MAMMLSSSSTQVDYYKDCKLITADIRSAVFSELVQLDELFGRIRLLCLKSGTRPYILMRVGSARLTREVTDYFGKQIANLLMEYANGIYFCDVPKNSVVVSAAERGTPAKWRDNLIVFDSLEEALREVSDEQGLTDEVISLVYHALYTQ